MDGASPADDEDLIGLVRAIQEDGALRDYFARLGEIPLDQRRMALDHFSYSVAGANPKLAVYIRRLKDPVAFDLVRRLAGF